MSDQEDNGGLQPAVVDDDFDDEVLSILLSTDSHLGYCEKDPIRGLDSFAAFEEVLRLAKSRRVDMVLFSGDLFHENKPSRNTLHKTMEIVRRYCMGPNPVRFQIISDQAKNFRTVNDCVNYEDENYSVDLPIFSIHGNHDDPTREGSTDMLAALDLLAVSNLVNYFGRQDEVDRVVVNPVLIRKGDTKVALYGMGSIRDERLNRMWQNKKVRFMRPTRGDDHAAAADDDDAGAEEPAWFNIFTLHQNRDLGRGSKNCVHESMIPEWMDLVVWGHEHECLIDPTESLVGTFRISQPGSSVATSLTHGEARRKHVGILQVRGTKFRLSPVPLSHVRAFAMKEISLSQEEGLDPEDPSIDENLSGVLEDHVNALVAEAREKSKILLEDAEATRAAHPENFVGVPEQKYKLSRPDEVLVRLKVEHSGYTAVNNQRFGARFVGEVANPSDILLFHRKRQESASKGGSGGKGKKSNSSYLDEPIAPEDLAEVTVEDIVKENLAMSEKRLEILDESRVGLALEDFVEKEQRQAINETVGGIITKQQKMLIKRAEDGAGNKIATKAAVLEYCQAETEKSRAKAAQEEEEQEAKAKKTLGRKRDAMSEGEDDDGEKEDEKMASGSSDDDVAANSKKRPRSSGETSSKGRKAAGKAQGKRSKKVVEIDDFSDDSSSAEEVAKPARARSSAQSQSQRRSPRKAASSARGRSKYNYDDLDDSDAEASLNDDDDDDLSEVEEVPPPKKRGAKKQTKSTAPKVPAFFSAKKPKAKPSTASRGRKRSAAYYDDDDSDDNAGRGMANLAAGWGSAADSQSQSRRTRMRR